MKEIKDKDERDNPYFNSTSANSTNNGGINVHNNSHSGSSKDSNLSGTELLLSRLFSTEWRLDNLYTIKDKEGSERVMHLNFAQRVTLLDYRHNKKVILKSRQQGISTLYLAYYLDKCLFQDGYEAGIQSYGRNESKKLKRRALLMWDRLDPMVKRLIGVKLAKSNEEGLEFSNGSVLKIGNFRGDTLQGLHVSELAKISKLFPEKALELKTGAFQAVSVNSKITIETTAEGDSGLFVDIWNLAVAVKDSGRTLTPMDFQAIFLPWYNDPDCYMEYDFPPTKKGDKYIEDIKKEIKGLDLTKGQLNWLYAKMAELDDDFDREYPATPERAFAVSVYGSYFSKQLKELQTTDRIKPIDYNPKYKVDVAFDLGLNDEMVLLFSQTIRGQVKIIYEYHNTGEGIPFYVEIMKTLAFNYNYGKIILPHDANVKDLSTGRTRVDTFRALGLSNIVLLPRLSFQESIEVARSLLKTVEIANSCTTLISALRNYRKKFDKAIGVYLERDVHDIHSNYGASLRYLGQGLSTYTVDSSKPTYKFPKRSSKVAL